MHKVNPPPIIGKDLSTPILPLLIPAVACLIFAISLGVRGCKAYRDQHKRTAPPVYNAPVIGYDPAAALGVLDPKTISPTNDGYMADLDGDGITDFVIMREGNALAWAKVQLDGTRQAETVILHITGKLTSYSVGMNNSRLGVFFSDDAYRQYFQACAGVNNGIPYFGNVEAQ